MYCPISISFLTTQLLVLVYITTISLCIPIDFQVGNYLHKFFKNLLPNNTEFKRRPGDADPYKKFYSRIYSQEPATEDDLPNIEGLRFKKADGDFPTIPVFNYTLTIGTYNPLTTTKGTTPDRESLLRMGNAFRDIFMKKSGFMRDTFGKFKAFMKNEGSTIDPEAIASAELDRNYDERFHDAMHHAENNMIKKIAEMYTNAQTETTTLSMFKNFMHEMKNVYHHQMANLFVTTTEPPVTEPPRTQPKPPTTLSSQELRDEENLRHLKVLDREFANDTSVEEALKDIYTPRPSEEK